nr:endonuclease III domain-containing protein [Desulfuromonadales bacterium]NIS43934.1 endonuclease III domain-containing protein [Desulfuromonadales bacterium]
IGPETADSIILYAAHKPSFVVDAYTRRIFTRTGLLPDDYDYERTRAFFMANLPQQTGLYNEYHALLVRLAKVCCRKRKPLCRECPLLDICQHGQSATGD